VTRTRWTAIAVWAFLALSGLVLVGLCASARAETISVRGIETFSAHGMRIRPHDAAGCPATGDWIQWSVAVGTDGAICVCTVGGSPGTWVQAADDAVQNVHIADTANPHAVTAAQVAAVPLAIFDAQTLLVAVADDAPAAITVAEDQIVGRVSAGDLGALTAAQVRTILGLAPGPAVVQMGRSTPSSTAGVMTMTTFTFDTAEIGAAYANIRYEATVRASSALADCQIQITREQLIGEDPEATMVTLDLGDEIVDVTYLYYVEGTFSIASLLAGEHEYAIDLVRSGSSGACYLRSLSFSLAN